MAEVRPVKSQTRSKTYSLSEENIAWLRQEALLRQMEGQTTSASGVLNDLINKAREEAK